MLGLTSLSISIKRRFGESDAQSSSRGRDRLFLRWLKGFTTSEQRPADAGVLVGDGDEGFVVVRARSELDHPSLEARTFIRRPGHGGIQSGSCTVDQE